MCAADVHYPTDVSLLWDAVRCLLRETGMLGTRGGAAKAAASLAASFRSRTPVSGPQRHCPRSTTGAREGESMPFPRQRSVSACCGRIAPFL